LQQNWQKLPKRGAKIPKKNDQLELAQAYDCGGGAADAERPTTAEAVLQMLRGLPLRLYLVR